MSVAGITGRMGSGPTESASRNRRPVGTPHLLGPRAVNGPHAVKRPGRADAADDVLTAREAPGEAEDQNGGQGGEGADARMLEVGGRREQENKSVPKFLLDRSWVEDLSIQGRSSGV